jgi:hypothetical protein
LPRRITSSFKNQAAVVAPIDVPFSYRVLGSQFLQESASFAEQDPHKPDS